MDVETKKKMNIGKILGIDLGTTNSVITLYDADKQEYIPIPSKEGNSLVPSVFYFRDSVIKVGDKAREEIKAYPESVIQSVKSKMDTPSYTYILENAKLIAGEYKEAKLTPIDISAYILKYIKKCADEYVGEPIKDVVITVPAYFREIERKATKRAAEKAGLNVVEIINEPTAACLAYGYANHAEDGMKRILVYDFGGGTFDVTLLNMSPEIYEVIKSGGDKIGGDDIDKALLDYIKKKVDIGEATDKQAKFICEEAKKVLSYEEKIELDFSKYGGGSITLTVTQFNRIITPIIDKTLTIVKNLMEGESDVDEVVLVGGSTRIPLIRKKLIEMFNLPKDYFDKYKVDPDKAVSIGACIRGRILLGDTDIILLDRTSYDLGIELDDGRLDPIIKRGSIIPTQGDDIYRATENSNGHLKFKVYQGNDPMARNNQYLGEIDIEVDKTLLSMASFRVTFLLDVSGVLTVEVMDLISREKWEAKVSGVIN